MHKEISVTSKTPISAPQSWWAAKLSSLLRHQERLQQPAGSSKAKNVVETSWFGKLIRRSLPVMHWGGVREASHIYLQATLGSQVPHRQASSEGVLISSDAKHRVIDVCYILHFRWTRIKSSSSQETNFYLQIASEEPIVRSYVAKEAKKWS